MNDISDTKNWTHQLHQQVKRFLKPILIAVCALVCAYLACQYYHRSKPNYVLEVMDRINTPSDLEQYSAYFTPKGRDIVLWLLKKLGDKPSSGSKTTYAEPAINGEVCDIPAQSGNTKFTIRLRKIGHWQFDDCYIESVQDKKIGLWTSYVKDHPVLTYLKLNWGDLAGAFLAGVMAVGK